MWVEERKGNVLLMNLVWDFPSFPLSFRLKHLWSRERDQKILEMQGGLQSHMTTSKAGDIIRRPWVSSAGLADCCILFHPLSWLSCRMVMAEYGMGWWGMWQELGPGWGLIHCSHLLLILTLASAKLLAALQHKLCSVLTKRRGASGICFCRAPLSFWWQLLMASIEVKQQKKKGRRGKERKKEREW